MKSNGYFHSHVEPLWQYAHGIITSEQRDIAIREAIRNLVREDDLQTEMILETVKEMEPA